MTILILGLMIFLGVHMARVLAPDWRNAMIIRMGEKPWKAAYSVLSIVGFVLIVWGYSRSWQSDVTLWVSPLWLKHVAIALIYVAFILLAAAYVPRNHFKAAIGHPMVAGTKLWAFAHLQANGRVAAVILFGSFLLWSMVLFAVSRKRDRAAGITYAAGESSQTIITVVVGTLAWLLFAFLLHGLLIGVKPL
jgi:uncharacterized membrane protein